jgi:hypothetical protein
MDWEVQDPWTLLGVVIAGAILMYIFNALTGAHRRTFSRDLRFRSIHRSGEALGARWRRTGSAIQSQRAQPSNPDK